MQALYKFTHIDTNTTTTISAVVLFGSVTVNITGGAGSRATVYDGDTSGSIIAIIDTSGALGTFLYDVFIRNGLVTVVTGGGTAGDITVASY